MAVKKGRLFLLLLLVAAVGLIIAGTLGQAVPDKTVLELTLAAPVAEEDWPDFGARFWEGDVVVFRDLLAALDRAKRDDRIAGISLEVSSNAGMNFGKMQELRAKLGELTAALEPLVRDPGQLARLAGAARRRAASRFDEATMLDRWERVLADAASRRRP